MANRCFGWRVRRAAVLAVTAATVLVAAGCGIEETGSSSSSSSLDAVMPDVVCMNLQDAQDEIQRAGVFFSRSEDATGKGRSQLVDRNWLVVGQRPAPGAIIGEGDAVLSVVKYGERSCGDTPTTPKPQAAPATPASSAAPIAQVSLMPDVVCMNLQDAQDLIQRAGVFYSRSRDATGSGRAQIVDRNWLVVGQSPPPGTPFGEGDAVLSVVKYGERSC
jgi:beta-lactam-binding protein with PASTA domain